MRIILSYDRVTSSSDPEYFSDLKEHLLLLKRRFTISFPEETESTITVNLLFSHASADFYYNLFPFLTEHNIKAVLGASHRYLTPEDVDKPSLKVRLTVPDTLAFQDDVFPLSRPFCCYRELRELAHSSVIKIACHGNELKNCVTSPQCQDNEIIHSKELIEKIINQPIDSFVFPFGRYNGTAYRKAVSHYRFLFVKGSALNTNRSSGLLFRIPLNDPLAIRKVFSLREIRNYATNFVYEKLRQLVRS